MGDIGGENPDVTAAYDLHREQVYRYLLRRSRSPDDAEELTQRVFADAVAALAKGERPDSLLAWLYTIAERRFIDEVRRRARAANYLERARGDAEPRPQSEYGPAVARALRRGVERLPVDQHRIIVMKVFEGRSFAEIAHEMNATEGACKMRFSRGITRLRDFLREEGIES